MALKLKGFVRSGSLMTCETAREAFEITTGHAGPREANES